VLSLVPVKRLVLSAQVELSEPRPKPSSTKPLPPRAEEEPTVVAVAEESSVPPPPVPAVAIEEGQTAAEATAPQAILELLAEVGPSGGDVVMILDEDPMPPPSSGSHDVVMTPASEPTPAATVADRSQPIEVSEPSPAVEMLEPPLATGAAGTSSAVDAVTVEEVIELATSRYIDFPSVGIINLEAPQIPEKVLEVATERMFTEPSIMETITSVLKAPHEYERAGGFAPAVAAKATDAALEAPAASMEPSVDAFVPPPANESQEASLPQPAEAAEATVVVAATGAAEAVVREAGSSPPRPVTMLTVYFGTPSMFITLWYGFVYGTNLPLGTLII
jgi:hypothetical protein